MLGRTLCISALCFAPHFAAAEMSAAKLIEALQSGGHILYIRHATTETDYADQITADPNNCSTQRTLSEAGWTQAKTIGAAIKALDIPTGTVTASQYCRAWQTADLAFGRYAKTAALNFEKAETYTNAQIETMRTNVMPLLTAQPETGANTVIVGHDDPFEAATGIYPEPQGVTYVLKPSTDGTFTVLGKIEPNGWPKAAD